MIKIEHVVLPSPEQMEFIIEGMRNPMNSWDKSDSCRCADAFEDCYKYICNECPHNEEVFGNYAIGENDKDLMLRLSKNGPIHRKYMRMMPVFVRITAPLYWWKEFDTYKVGTVSNSCSTMHKIQEKEFTLEDFSTEHMTSTSKMYTEHGIIYWLNHYRNIYLNGGDDIVSATESRTYEPKDKNIWWQMIQLLPSSYNQTRNVSLNYEVLSNIYYSPRWNHKLDEWVEFCKWIETLPYSEIILSKEKNNV